jgi:hypothetical protein
MTNEQEKIVSDLYRKLASFDLVQTPWERLHQGVKDDWLHVLSGAIDMLREERREREEANPCAY